MSLVRKTRKLLRNPARFFADSAHPELRKAGSFIWKPRQASGKQTKARGKTPAKPAAPATPAADATPAEPSRPPEKVAPDQPESRALDHRDLRDAGRLIGGALEGALSIDVWAWHRMVNESARGDGPALVIVPSGLRLWDELWVDVCRRAGVAASFLPLWNVFGAQRDVNAIEEALASNLIAIPAATRRLVLELDRSRVEGLIAAYDGTPFSRNLLQAARRMGIRTACVLPSSPAVDRQYHGDQPLVQMPIADHVATSHARAAWLRSRRPDLLEIVARPTGERSRPQAAPEDEALLGISPQDDVVVVLGPSLQLGLDEEQLIGLLDEAITAIADQIGPYTHLVLALSGFRDGYLGRSARTSLQNIYRKTVVQYGEPMDLLPLLARASRVHACDPADEWILQVLGLGGAVAARASLEPRGDTRSPSTGGGAARVTPEELVARIRDQGKPPVGLAAKLAFIEQVRSTGRMAFDVIAVPDPMTSKTISEGRQRHLCPLVGANTRRYGAEPEGAALADIVIQWGAEPNESKSRPEILRALFGKHRLFLEDGFVRSMGLWVDAEEPTLSVIMDTDSVYYDATHSSLMEQILNSDWTLAQSDRERSRRLIDRIVVEKISKYNYAPITDLGFSRSTKRKILLVDQRAGDMSIKYGMASEKSFADMIAAAEALGADAEIIIKQHPCAITNGAHEAHYTRDRLGAFARQPNVHLIAFDVNPYSLMEAIDEVWVVSSGMGFEALMAGKSVSCFGVPFYSSWGFTTDMIPLPRRTRTRTLEEVFYVAYLWLTRYFDPVAGNVCELERLLDYIQACRDEP